MQAAAGTVGKAGAAAWRMGEAEAAGTGCRAPADGDASEDGDATTSLAGTASSGFTTFAGDLKAGVGAGD